MNLIRSFNFITPNLIIAATEEVLKLQFVAFDWENLKIFHAFELWTKVILLGPEKYGDCMGQAQALLKTVFSTINS